MRSIHNSWVEDPQRDWGARDTPNASVHQVTTSDPRGRLVGHLLIPDIEAR